MAATRLTYTTGTSAEVDEPFEDALAAARASGAHCEERCTLLRGSGLSGKGGRDPYYVQQFIREQGRTVVAP